MLVLFETPAGYALFKVINEGKLKKADNVHKLFESPDAARKILELKDFSKFENTARALEETTALMESKVTKTLKKFLQKSVVDQKLQETLAVSDAKLGGLIREKVGITCVHNAQVEQLLRGIREHLTNLVSGLSSDDLQHMVLGLSHSLCRYKLKFSPDKVDVMIVQAIALLDDLDKELNTYAMRVKEWYGWHFPELARVVGDNILFARVIRKMGVRTKAATTDFSEMLTDDVAELVVEAAKVSMGTEISEEDITRIQDLATQVIEIHEYREQLNEYLRNRMVAIAPNLSVLVGELVGARLIAHAGSLLNLAKYPASTVQILGAEKALFRALKTKKDTPKYGLIFNASVVGQVAPKYKGKISRSVAAKASLAIRVDALGEGTVTDDVGIRGRASLEARLRQVAGVEARSSGAGATKIRPDHAKQAPASLDKASKGYNAAEDTTMLDSAASSRKRGRDAGDDDDDAKPAKKEKKSKDEKKDKKEKEKKKDKKKDKKK